MFTKQSHAILLYAIKNKLSVKEVYRSLPINPCHDDPIQSIKFSCFQYNYPQLESQFTSANLSPYNNLWSEVHDFSADSTDKKNFQYLQEFYKVSDFLPKCSNNDLDTSDKNSLVPLTASKCDREGEDVKVRNIGYPKNWALYAASLVVL